jgi:hypothetical protein
MKDKQHIMSRGQPSISQKYSEETTAFRFILPISQMEHLREQSTLYDITMAEYVRRLIDADMAQKTYNND